MATYLDPQTFDYLDPKQIKAAEKKYMNYFRVSGCITHELILYHTEVFYFPHSFTYHTNIEKIIKKKFKIFFSNLCEKKCISNYKMCDKNL